MCIKVSLPPHKNKVTCSLFCKFLKMIIPKLQSMIMVLLAILFAPLTTGHTPAKCSRSCGGISTKHLPSPFGFSSGCLFRLNCTENNTMVVQNFPVQLVTSETILINLPATCGRPIAALGGLFGPTYAPTSRNGILLENCSTPIKPCMIPTTTVQTHFELLGCDSKPYNISCYSEPNNYSQFIDYDNVMRSGCGSLFSGISSEAIGNSSGVSLDVQVVQLGWWLEGDCKCSPNSNCTRIVSSTMNGRPGYRCYCLEGFEGDGYPAGSGCRKASPECNFANYMTGKCGGTARIGVLVGGVAVAALMVSLGIIYCLVRRRSDLRTRYRTLKHISETMDISIPIYPYKEIERATDSFSDKQRLGMGGYGTVYLGKLHTNEWVAIKRIKHRDTDSIEQVMNEIKLISSVSHPNLVRLLGCSIEYGEQILVYEFMPNGTLSQHLHGERSDGLTWPVRLTIATEAAQAISYLHSEMNPPIYHRDIKSSNILLDYNFKTKVADFGLSRLGMIESSHISTAPQGTPGYLDPQYHQDFHLSDKSDVYSFGVVLVEIITGLKAVDFSRPNNEVNLAALAIDRIKKRSLEEIIDTSIEPHGDAWTLSSVHKVAEVAFRCLASHRDMRPSMTEVAAELEQIRLSRWASSEENITASSKPSSSCSSSSDISEKPLTATLKNAELNNGGLFALQIESDSMSSVEKVNEFSPVSVQDSWASEQSLPSSNSMVSHVIQ
ncbi:wall-associated receptor kinase-like 14 [Cornus florida]|uniref:wall-associated receptor kinase-like 14 n=1 Tax=Cornus florida TaxID=4283 RepID=UPI0028A17085|nr:wall-associated receptor kinase-like 14 [Cornus florida]